MAEGWACSACKYINAEPDADDDHRCIVCKAGRGEEVVPCGFDPFTGRLVRACDALARVQVLKVPARHWTGVYQHNKTEEKVAAELVALWGPEWTASAWHQSDVLFAALFHRPTGRCIVHFRGSTVLLNWVADIKDKLVPNDTLGINVHRGFNDLAKDVFPALVGKLRNSTWPIVSLELSGHSLGGAMAVLMAMYFEVTPLRVPGGADKVVASAITTSGQPMFTDADLGKGHGSEIVRVVSAKLLRIRNEVDPVCLAFEGYRHIGEELFFGRNGTALTGVTHFGEADATAHTPPVPKSGFLRRFIKTAASHVTNSEVGYLPPIELWAAKVEGGAAALEASCAARRAAIAVWVTEFSEESSHSV